MRLLVLADSHGAAGILDRIIRREQTAKHIFFLGDKVADIEEIKGEYQDRVFHTVRGNGDFFAAYPDIDTVDIENTKIYFTHGHLHAVGGGTEKLLSAANKCGAKIALYAHTHIPENSYTDGIYLVNPGSVSLSREGANSYAVIDITDSGILVSIKKV